VERPFVSLKLATSLDGKIALANGKSQWITCEKSRLKGRELRGEHAAIAVGANTALLDDPKLTTRIEGLNDPVRVIYDSQSRLSLDSQLVQTCQVTPVILFCQNSSTKSSITLKNKGILVAEIPKSERGLSVTTSLEVLMDEGIESVLVEGGGTLAASFLIAGVVDKIHWFRAPVILGGDGRNCIGDMNLLSLDKARTYRRLSVDMIGPDTYEVLERR